jgi:hypothetical protein
MRGIAFSLAVSVALLFPALPADAQQVKPSCVQDSRKCLIVAAQAYLDGLTTHDGSKVPLAPNARRTLNAHKAIEGEAAVRKAIDGAPPIENYRNTRFVVDTEGHQITYFTLLGLKSVATGPNTAGANGGPITLHLAQRFTVRHGLIEEIESIDFSELGTMDGSSNWPDKPAK